MFRSSRSLAALATMVTGVGVGAFALAPAAQADTTTVTYFYSGAEQTFHVPVDVHQVTVVAVGGWGGSSSNVTSTGDEAGGAGAMMPFAINVSPNTTLYVEVGGNGQDGMGGDAAGGWNGGGTGKGSSGAGGGGASDVRTISVSGANTLASRQLVAGGGGGAAVGTPGGASGSDGGPADTDCTFPGGPGSSGYSNGTGGASGATGFGPGQDGSSGSGGAGGAFSNGTLPGGGGGGGGYVGGGGGGSGPDCGGGGGGGSSFQASGSTFVNTGVDFGNRGSVTISYTVPMKPLVTTTPASDITQTSARLNGVLTPETVTPPDAGALCYFDYGLDANYGTHTFAGSCGAGMDQVYFWDTLSNLTPGTTYFYRLVASNRYGFSYDVINGQSFTTLAAPPAPAPAATTSPATNVGQRGARLNGVVNPKGAATSYHFEYGKTASYGTSTPTLSAGSGSANVKEHALLSGLARHTTYHFRVVAVSGNGTTNGLDRTFHTG